MKLRIALLVALTVAMSAAALAQDDGGLTQKGKEAAKEMAGVEFSMSDHVHEYAEDTGCVDCHNRADDTFVPKGDICLECHQEEALADVTYGGLSSHGPLWSLSHGPATKGNVFDCMECHTDQYDCLECHKAGLINDDVGGYGQGLANVHRSEFTVTHPIAARTDQRLCTTCHEQSFCVDCHEDFNPADLAVESHRKGWSNLTGGGAVTHESFNDSQCQTCHVDSVLPSHQWSSSHAIEARKNLATCQACHPDGDVCLTCHSAVSGLGVSPHPGDWGDFEDNLRKASDGKTCRKCH